MGSVRLFHALRLGASALLILGGCLASAGCHSVPGTGEASQDAESKKGEVDKKSGKPPGENKEEVTGAVDVGFLLTMKYEEAKRLSPQSMELPPAYKVAADEITVLSKNSDGTPRKVRAKGHVFLQIDFREELTALGQEALIGSREVILRGKPLLRRGRSVVEGLEDRTVFYVQDIKLHAIGLHRITSESGVTPSWRGSWKDGPNPLLPALSPEDVPKGLRATPLLPPLSKDDLPKSPR